MTNQRRFGSMQFDGGQIVKPLSITRWSVDRTCLWKLYRGIDPRGRHHREVEALARAVDWGIAVPEVLATGRHRGNWWAIFSAVPGHTRRTCTDEDVRTHLRDAHVLTERLARVSRQLTPGPGWGLRPGGLPDHRLYMLGQLSQRCQRYGWWAELSYSLRSLAAVPVVYLHGDLKGEHFIVNGDETYVVDWEASGRGPAACDHADVVFHIVRDFLYDGKSIEASVISMLAELDTPAPVLAWRLIRWIDRRRPQDLSLVPTSGLRALVHEDDAAAACQRFVRIVADLRAGGVPR